MPKCSMSPLGLANNCSTSGRHLVPTHATCPRAFDATGRTHLPFQAISFGPQFHHKPLSTATLRAAAIDEQPSLQSTPVVADTFPVRRLSSQEAMDAFYSSQHQHQRDHFAAFYSSELGGIVTDPALMVVHLDDHMVHRGHAVFDTALLSEGYLYELGAHVERFLASAAKANVPLPPGISPQQLMRVLLETAAASRLQNGHLRFFLSAGRGGFELSGNDCIRSTLYVIVIRRPDNADDSEEHLRGWRVKTSPVPPKAPFFSALKSTNYLPNALALMDAEAEGYHQGIFVDANGHVAEGPNGNVGVITQEGVLVVPPFDASLPGTTMRRLLELARDAIARKVLDGVARIERRHFTVEEAKACREVFLVGSGAVVMPVVTWDDVAIGDGVAGMGALQLRALMQGDMRPGSNGDHTQVPYGVMTGMGA